MNREWALPIILGLLAVAALWTVPHGPKEVGEGDGPDATGTHSSSTTTTAAPKPALVLPFGRGDAIKNENLTFLVLTPRGSAAALDAVEPLEAWDKTDRFDPQGEALALYTRYAEGPVCGGRSNTSTSCPEPHWAYSKWTLPKAYGVYPTTRPLLGVDGYNGTRITVHVFDENGLLAATNAPANQTAAFAGDSRPQQLPAGVWYVGANSTAPNGTQPIPAMAKPLFEQLKPLMRGLPVGGVASVRSDAYAAVYGTLYVTVRIDGLEYAP